MNIGLTGGIASGKSMVSQLLLRRGAIVIDADLLAREVVQPGAPALAQVAKAFGIEVLNEDGSLNRKYLGGIIFADEEKRKRLDELLHPPIIKLMKERMERQQVIFPDKLVVVDVPLLYESGMEELFGEVMVVYTDPEVQKKRLMERDRLNVDDAELRLNAQIPIEWKKEWADYVIDNSGSVEETERQVEDFWQGKGLI